LTVDGHVGSLASAWTGVERSSSLTTRGPVRAASHDRTGPARDVLRVAELPTPTPGPGEVRVRVAWSSVNPSDAKSRAGATGRPLPSLLVVPHSDGAGVVGAVGEGVPPTRVGERVWVWNAAWGRAFGTAAEYVVLPAEQAVPLPGGVPLEVGACLGIPALTAYHAVTTDGGVVGKRVLVAGGAGAAGATPVAEAGSCAPRPRRPPRRRG
jgi:NADPH:quinone reductase